MYSQNRREKNDSGNEFLRRDCIHIVEYLDLYRVLLSDAMERCVSDILKFLNLNFLLPSCDIFTLLFSLELQIKSERVWKTTILVQRTEFSDMIIYTC